GRARVARGGRRAAPDGPARRPLAKFVVGPSGTWGDASFVHHSCGHRSARVPEAFLRWSLVSDLTFRAEKDLASSVSSQKGPLSARLLPRSIPGRSPCRPAEPSTSRFV